MKTNIDVKKLDKGRNKGKSVYANITEQIKAIEAENDEKIYLYVENGKIVIERVKL